MKRLILCLVLVFGLVQFCNLVAQDVQVEHIHLGSITNVPMKVASVPGDVVACGVGICDSSWNPVYIIEYYSGQSWYMYIFVLNWATVSKSFKLEFDLRYNDGAKYYVYRGSASIPALSWDAWRINATSYVAKLGLLTLTGRVYGTGMGNDNKVTSQVVSY